MLRYNLWLQHRKWLVNDHTTIGALQLIFCPRGSLITRNCLHLGPLEEFSPRSAGCWTRVGPKLGPLAGESLAHLVNVFLSLSNLTVLRRFCLQVKEIHNILKCHHGTLHACLAHQWSKSMRFLPTCLACHVCQTNGVFIYTGCVPFITRCMITRGSSNYKIGKKKCQWQLSVWGQRSYLTWLLMLLF